MAIRCRPHHAYYHAPCEDPRACRLESFTSDGYVIDGDHDGDDDDHDDN
jgi:hypothetical protein